MLSAIRSRLGSFVDDVIVRAKSIAREAARMLPVLSGLATDIVRSREELIAENVLLRQQLIVASRKAKRPAFLPHERGLLAAITKLVPCLRDAVLLVKPDTILRWHREGFRLFWKRKTKSRQREQRFSAELVALIQRMARENRLWGAERIRGELLKLGIKVAKRTIQRHMPAARPPARPRGQSWHSFLRNHTVWACDFLQVYDVWFRPIFAFFVVDINTKRVVHVAVTRHPTQQWTTQQLREVTPFGEGPQFLIRDRDDKFGADFDRVAKGAGIKIIKTAVRAPLMNSVVERFLGTVRRECLDHIVILGERHLRCVLAEYCYEYFNVSRPHQGLGNRVPASASDELCGDITIVVSIPVLGGLHHDYRHAA